MRRSHFYSYGRRAVRDPDKFVADMHEALGEVMERAMDIAFKVIDHVPWTADEITNHVEDFVNRHVPDAERCAQDAWDDTR
jgi:hypothetical protein